MATDLGRNWLRRNPYKFQEAKILCSVDVSQNPENPSIQAQPNRIPPCPLGAKCPPICDNPQPVDIKELTGKWNADDGGTYYLRQIGNALWWYGESAAINPGFSNVFMGTIQLNEQCENRPPLKVVGTISGNWADVPKGNALSSGVIQLEIKSTGNTLRATNKTGGFSGGVWTR